MANDQDYQDYVAYQQYSQTQSPDQNPNMPLPDNSAMKSYVEKNVQTYNATPNQGQKNPVVPAQNFLESLEAGLQISTAGLAIRGKMPDTVLPEHAPRAYRIASQIGTLAGDLPAMVAGGFGGGLVGGSEGATIGSIVPGVGTAIGGIGLGAVGASAGAFALPPALRRIMMDHYEKGDIQTSGDFVDRLMATSWEALKGGVTGAATAITGGAAGAIAGPLAKLGTELGTMTTVGAAMEGHLPNAQDFIDGAIVLGGVHAAATIAPKLRNIYAKTGERPEEITELASRDVDLKQQLLSEDQTKPIEATPTELKSEVTPVVDQDKTPVTSEVTHELATKEKGLPDPTSGEPPGPRSDDEANILNKIGVSEKPTEKTIAEKFDDFYAKNIDYLDPLLSAIKEAEKNNGELIPSEENAYNKGRLFAAYMDKVRSFFEFGTRDAKSGAINGEGLNEIYRDIPDDDLNGYRAYGMAQRALELNNRGLKPWKDFDAEGAQRVVDAGKAKYEEINQRRINFENRVLDYAKDKGLFDEESVQRMKDANQAYFPFNRIQDADVFSGKVQGAAAIKRIFGSDKNVLDPILQTYKNVEMLVRKAEVNDVRNAFIDNMRQGKLLAEEGSDVKPEDAYLQKVPVKMLPEKIGSEQLASALKKQGIQVTPDDITVFRPDYSYLKDNQIAVYEDGKRVIYEGPPGVIDSLKRLEGDRTALDTWTQIMAKFSTATRVGTVMNPAFAFRHFFRSQIMASVYSKTGMIPFVDSALALKDMMAKSEDYQNWLYNGGATSSWLKLDDTYLADNKIEAADKEAPFIGKAWNTVKDVGEAAETFIKLTDNLSRLAEYKKSVAQGVSPEEAAFRSREVVPDYQKVGLQRSVLRSGVAFIGAHINSLDRMFQAFTEDPKSTIAKLSVITAISGMVWAVNKDDPAIDALPDWQKNTYWNLNLSKILGNNADGSAVILRLSKPWAPGILFGTGAEVALDQLYKSHPNQVQHFAESLMSSVVPEPIPNIAAPVLEQYANKNIFTGRPLVSQDKEKLLPELMYDPYTSQTAKAIAKIIGYVPLVKDIGPSSDPLSSPAVVDNYIRSWTGTLGGWALKISDQAINETKKQIVAHSSMSQSEKDFELAKLNNNRAEPWTDSPFIKEFVTRYPNFKDQSIQDFYENKDQTSRVLNSIKAYAKQGDINSAMALSEAHPDLEIKLDGIGKAIATARKTYQNVQDNPYIPVTEKRQTLDTILFQIGSMAKMGNQMMSDFQKAVKQNKVDLNH